MGDTRSGTWSQRREHLESDDPSIQWSVCTGYKNYGDLVSGAVHTVLSTPSEIHLHPEYTYSSRSDPLSFPLSSKTRHLSLFSSRFCVSTSSGTGRFRVSSPLRVTSSYVRCDFVNLGQDIRDDPSRLPHLPTLTVRPLGKSVL